MASRVDLGDREGFHQADDDDDHCAWQQVDHLGSADTWNTERWQTGGDVADDGDAVVGEVQEADSRDRTDDHDERTRHRRQPSFYGDHDQDRNGRYEHCRPVCVRDCPPGIGEVVGEFTSWDGYAEDVLGLRHTDDQCSTSGEPDQHCVGEQVDSASQFEDASDDVDGADDERERRGELQVGSGVLICKRFDRCRREERYERHGTDRELP